MYLQQTTFENIVRKGEIACNEQFLLFPQCFQLNQITVSPFVHIFDIVSLFAIESEEPKIGQSGKGFRFDCKWIYHAFQGGCRGKRNSNTNHIYNSFWSILLRFCFSFYRFNILNYDFC